MCASPSEDGYTQEGEVGNKDVSHDPCRYSMCVLHVRSVISKLYMVPQKYLCTRLVPSDPLRPPAANTNSPFFAPSVQSHRPAAEGFCLSFSKPLIPHERCAVFWHHFLSRVAVFITILVSLFHGYFLRHPRPPGLKALGDFTKV